MDVAQANAWLSSTRFRPFLDRAGGDHGAAVLAYRDYVDLGAATFSTIHWFELLVRTAIDRVLAEGQPQTPLHATWLMDFSLLRPDTIRMAVTAAERLPRGEPLTRDRVVAGVPFGFWASLFDRRYEDLWRKHLVKVFPGAALRRVDVDEPMRRAQHLRNRIAHHDTLPSEEIRDAVAELRVLAGWVDPAAAAWLARVADLDGLLSTGDR